MIASGRRRFGPAMLTTGIGLLVAQGCGSSQKEARSPSTAEPARPADTAAYGQGGVPRADDGKPSQPNYPSAPPPPPGAPAGMAQPGSRALVMRQAAIELDVAEREILVASGDCRSACRALGSMDRATGHLCELAVEPDDRDRCDDAKAKLLVARDRVRSTCGSCPGGASVERAAPIPSVP